MNLKYRPLPLMALMFISFCSVQNVMAQAEICNLTNASGAFLGSVASNIVLNKHSRFVGTIHGAGVYSADGILVGRIRKSQILAKNSTVVANIQNHKVLNAKKFILVQGSEDCSSTELASGLLLAHTD